MRRFLLGFFCVALLLSTRSIVCAGEQSRKLDLIRFLTPLVDKVAANLPNKNMSVKVKFAEGDVPGPRCQSNILSTTIEDLLKKKELSVISNDSQPDLWLTGQLVAKTVDDKPAVELSLALKNSKEPLHEPVRQLLTDPQLCFFLFGITGAPETSNNKTDRFNSIAALLMLLNPPNQEKPTPLFYFVRKDGNFSKTRIQGKQGSPYSVEILVAPASQISEGAENPWKNVSAREITVGERGEPEVKIEPGEAYAVRLYYEPTDPKLARENGHGAGIELFIDGLSDFHFSKIRSQESPSLPKYHHWFIGPGRSVVPGWHSTNEKSHLFLVSELGKGVAAGKDVPEAVKPTDKIGMISVCFYACWRKGKKPPQEIDGLKDTGTAATETIVGKEIKNSVEEVRGTQMSEKMIDFVAIRYNRKK